MFQVQQHKANEWVSVSIDFKSIDPALRNTRRVGGIWRIIRIADNVVIAQSKSAPADTSTSTPETVASAPAPEAAQAEPVADADLPFAEGIDDSEQGSEQRVIETTPAQLVAAILGLPVTSERATIWTHNADDTPFPFITDWRKCHQVAWLFAERGAVSGHGRKAKSTVKGQKRVKSQSVVQLANMERKSPKIAQIGANRGVPVSVLPQMTRTLETRKRAA